MKEPYYTIKEASAKVGVESHVLRYWEEELKMDIHRNQMGHRYYTEHDIELLTMVRKLKDKGLQLKAIRSYIEKRQEQMKGQRTGQIADEMSGEMQNTKNGSNDKNEVEDKKELVPVSQGNGGIMSNAEKLEQFQRIMNRILSNAIQENNELIGRTAGEHAANAVVTQFQGMTKEQEERAEERYRKLDQTLREIQLARKEAAAANMITLDKRKSKRLKRKSKQHTEGMTAKDVGEETNEKENVEEFHNNNSGNNEVSHRDANHIEADNNETGHSEKEENIKKTAKSES